jgi:hypothetical protein
VEEIEYNNDDMQDIIKSIMKDLRK